MTDNTKKNLLVEIEFPLNALNKKQLYFDNLVFNPLHWKKRLAGKHEFGLDVEKIVPKEGEIRLLGNRHRDCRYYSLGNKIY